MTHTRNATFYDRLVDAARRGDQDAICQWATHCNKEQRSNALRRAAEYGHVACVKLLIPVADPKDLDSDALRLAARGGHVECVKLLIPVSDPATDNSVALVAAAMNGHLECVRVLLPVSNPKDDNSLPLQWACQNNDRACFDLLYPLSDPHAALKNLAKDPDRPTQNMWLLHERIEMEQQRDRLDHAIGSKSALSGLRKI